MQITTPHTNLFENRQELYQFLNNVSHTLHDKKPQKIVSISLQIPPIDPLAVLQSLPPQSRHFYIEKSKEDQAILAIDSVLKFTVKGVNRFAQVQQFINHCLANNITIGDSNLTMAGLHFFCSFTFFPESDSLFSPATVFLPRWQVSRTKDYSVIVANILLDFPANIEQIFDNLWYNLSLIYSSINRDLKLHHLNYSHNNKQWIFNQFDFKNSVQSAIKSIKNNEFSKIVLAQAVDVVANQPFSLVHSLDNLRQNYPDCYVFSLSNNQGQNFIGASPEKLIKIHNQQLETDALAGSAPRGKNEQEDIYLANLLLISKKEKHEHQVVIEFILQRLLRLGIKPDKMPLPSLLKLSNIQHLWTPIKAIIPHNIHPLEIIAELHPTPAVAGVPRDITCEQIRQYESFDRSVYAAPLGWIDGRGNSEFIVGIRSAIIDGDRAQLFAGAGIVAGSDPDQELAEIQLKLQALLKNLV